jgi:Protein of unknown function (DUF3011).
MHVLRFGLAFASLLLAGCVGYYPPSGSAYPDGYPGGSYGPGDPGTGSVVRCESLDGRTRYCDADVRGGVRLTRQLSRTECVRGRNWDYDNRGIRVGGGCRAEFATGGGSGGYAGGSYAQQTIRCESTDGRERHCSVPVRSGVQLSRQLSRTPCVQGRNWRWDRNGVWVTDGCRGEFRVY